MSSAASIFDILNCIKTIKIWNFDVKNTVILTFHRHVYFGEYPLSFAACLGQEECVRLLVAKGANPNYQDSNGNTVMHMLVIHDRKVGTGNSYWSCDTVTMVTVNVCTGHMMVDLIILLLPDSVWLLFLVDFLNQF